MARKTSFIDKTKRRRSNSGADLHDRDKTSTETPSLIEQAFEQSSEDDDAVDATVLASDTVVDVVKKFARLRAKKAKADENVDKIKAELRHLEEWILEQMAGECQNMKVNVEIDGVDHSFTVYQIEDSTVWKAKGVATSDLCRALERVGWSELVGETVNNRTLKATVREAMKAKRDGLFKDADRWFCPSCDSYFGDDSLTTFVDRVGESEMKSDPPPACGGCSDPESNHFVMLVEIGETGIPKKLESLLEVQDVKKLGVRRA